MTDVVVVGGINQDVFVHVDHRPAPGETVVGAGPRLGTGGKGANMAVAAARAGASVSLCGAVGDDGAGHAQLSALERSGVDVSRVARRHGIATGMALIAVTPDGENSIVVGTGANATPTPEQVYDACANARIVVAQTEVGSEPVIAAARVAAATGARLLLSPAPITSLPLSVLRQADPLIVNQSEAADMMTTLAPGTPGTPPTSAATLVQQTGARSVVVTLGAAGVDVADQHGTVQLPAPTAQVVDTTGAGDVFAGTLAAQLAIAVRADRSAAGRDTGDRRPVGGPGDGALVHAAELALAAASAAVTRLGAR